jgi:hypothetical protein
VAIQEEDCANVIVLPSFAIEFALRRLQSPDRAYWLSDVVRQVIDHQYRRSLIVNDRPCPVHRLRCTDDIGNVNEKRLVGFSAVSPLTVT